MAAFRFRAAAALDLRRQQETAAATALARVEAEFRAAGLRRDAAEAERRGAQERALDGQRTGIDGNSLLWHRNWIARLSDTVALRARELDTWASAVREAEQVWREARRRRLALERMRDRAWRRHLQAEQRQELKAIDELARLRFVLAGEERNEA
jgi:flagellar export protein FliJ